MSVQFTDEEMTSDKPYDQPVMNLTVSNGEARPQLSKADEYFESNAFFRVPLIALESDVYRLQGQNWAVFSLIKPEEYRSLKHKNGEYSGLLIKFRGVFASKEDAEAHIKKILSVDKHFDVHLVPAFSWAGVEDDSLEDREYANEMIGEIMKGYFENENRKIQSIRERIKYTEKPDSMRSEEASSFFLSAAGAAAANETQTCEVEVPFQQQETISLDALASRYQVDAGAKARYDYGSLSNVQSVVTELLIENEDLE
jgi:hypothetical protein